MPNKARISLRRKQKQSGFSLLEVIVALAVLAICVSVILRIFSGVTAATRITDDYSTALEIAETQMALLVAQDNPVGSDTGSVGENYRWHSRVSEFSDNVGNPLFDEGPLIDPESIYIPYHYQVTVSWGSHKKREFQLSTIRLGIKP